MKKFMELENNRGDRGLISLDKVEFIFERETDNVHTIVIDTTNERIELEYPNESVRDKTYNQIKEFLRNDAIILALEGGKR